VQPLTLAFRALALLAADPFPLAPGTWWEYRESYAQSLGGLDSITDEVTRFELRGSLERPFVLQRGGADPSSGPVERGEGWIRLLPWTGEEPLPLPLEPGRSAAPTVEGGAGWSVEEEERLTVPAGTFRVLRCALRTRSAVSLLWIAPGIGVVRETHGPPGARPEIERVLLRWSGSPVSPAPPRAPRRRRGAELPRGVMRQSHRA
jgi:hypothetical protein